MLGSDEDDDLDDECVFIGCKWVDEVVEGSPYIMSEEYLKYVIDR